jgi:hypothetical protein
VEILKTQGHDKRPGKGCSYDHPYRYGDNLNKPSGLVVRVKQDESMIIMANDKQIQVKRIHGNEFLVVADKDVKILRPGTAEFIDGKWQETTESKERRK